MGLLLMLITIAGLLAALAAFIVAVLTGQRWLKRFVVGAAAIWAGVYFVSLLAVSLVSEERVLGPEEPKAYCGFYLDCHLHTTLAGIERTKTIGKITANGEFVIASIRVSSNAKLARLGLSGVNAEVHFSDGSVVKRDASAERELGTIAGKPFETPIKPDESFIKKIVFDLPENASGPKLLITEGSGIDRAFEALLIGDEDSLLHKRTFFGLARDGHTAEHKRYTGVNPK